MKITPARRSDTPSTPVYDPARPCAALCGLSGLSGLSSSLSRAASQRASGLAKAKAKAGGDR